MSYVESPLALDYIMKNLSLIVALCLLVGGCAVAAHNKKAFENQRPATEAEIAAILEAARNFLYDPYSVRDAEISSAVVTMGIDQRLYPNVCVKANAKNAFGGYTGRKTTMLSFDDSARIINVQQGYSAEAFCRNTTFRPFQEIERLKAL